MIDVFWLAARVCWAYFYFCSCSYPLASKTIQKYVDGATCTETTNPLKSYNKRIERKKRAEKKAMEEQLVVFLFLVLRANNTGSWRQDPFVYSFKTKHTWRKKPNVLV